MRNQSARSLTVLTLQVLWLAAFLSVPTEGNGRVRPTPVAAAFNEKAIYLLLDSPRAGAPKSSYTSILCSRDNGGTWEPIDLPDVKGSACAADIALDKNGFLYVLRADGAILRGKSPFKDWENLRVGFFDVFFRRLWTTPKGQLACLHAGDSESVGDLLTSGDRAETWNRAFPESQSVLYGMEPSLKGDCFIRLVNQTTPNSYVVSASTGKGGEWLSFGTLYHDKLPHANEVDYLDVVRILGDSILMAGSNGAGEISMAYASRDRGKTWNAVEVAREGTSDGPLIRDGLMLNDHIAVLVLDDRLITTKDGGKSWSCTWQKKEGGACLRRCYQLPSGKVLVVGSVLLESADGSTWTEKSDLTILK